MDKKRHRDAEADAHDRAASGEGKRRLSDETTSSVAHAQPPVEVVLVEPFYGGSHKQLVDLLVKELLAREEIPHILCTLPPRKWHWRLMAASMHFATAIPKSPALRVLFVTAMVNLAELLGLRPDLQSPRVRKILYFHENQLTYPFQVPTATKTVQSEDERAGNGNKDGTRRKVAAEDFHIGWSQILSSLAADELVFNSEFNRTSFLGRVDAFVNKIPEPELRYRDLAMTLRAKSRVLYFPLQIPPTPTTTSTTETKPVSTLTILWNHRWEYDKNPDDFFSTLLELDEAGLKFRVVVLGEGFNESPAVFETARAKLEATENVEIVHWGFAPSRDRYFELLRLSDVVVSTSLHEFYGVAVLEALLCGCYPLVPNRLVYPEFFDGANVFNTQRQLFKKLKYFCTNPFPARQYYVNHGQQFEKFTWHKLRNHYRSILANQ